MVGKLALLKYFVLKLIFITKAKN